jgi:molecular chaperone GrpE
MSNEEIENPKVEDIEPENIEVTEDPAALLEDARNKADEHWNELLRAKAEMENLRRRQARDLENAHKHALDKFVNELLPVCDSMELGLNAAQSEEASLETVRDGLEMTLKMFMTSIAKFGLEPVNPENETFNPELHQAMAMQAVEGVEANQVLTVAQKGYQFNGRLLRPAMVVVSQ